MHTRKYRAVIFDVDGLIVDTEELYFRTFNATLADHGASAAREDFTRYVGHPVGENARDAVTRYRLPIAPEAFSQTWMDRFEQTISDPAEIDLMPGFLDLLYAARQKGYRLGIASATQRPRMLKTLTNGLLVHLDGVASLDDIFAAILSGSDVDHAKPAPDIYLLAAEQLGAPPSRCLAFEDSQAGAESAKAAGMTVIAVPNFFTAGQDHTAADTKLSSLQEAVDYL